MTFDDAYFDGQADALRWLAEGAGADDYEFAPLHEEIAFEWAWWCLLHNLSMAGALAQAVLNGKKAGFEWKQQYVRYVRGL